VCAHLKLQRCGWSVCPGCSMASGMSHALHGVLSMSGNRITDKQLVELIRRRNLDPSDSQFISRELMTVLFSGGLNKPHIWEMVQMQIRDISWQIDRMIDRGFHSVAGMSERAYRKLWPTEVFIPSGWNPHDTYPICVDRSFTIAQMSALAEVSLQQDLSSLIGADLIDLSHNVRDDVGQVLVRYVAFTRRILNKEFYGRNPDGGHPYAETVVDMSQALSHAFFQRGGYAQGFRSEVSGLTHRDADKMLAVCDLFSKTPLHMQVFDRSQVFDVLVRHHHVVSV